MKAIFINSQAQTISEVPMPKNLNEIYELLDCQYIEAAIHLLNGDVIYTDDEACLYEDEFIHGGFDCPGKYFGQMAEFRLLGNGLLIGSTGEGEDAPPKTTVEEIAAVVKWVDRDTAIAHAHTVQDKPFEFIPL